MEDYTYDYSDVLNDTMLNGRDGKIEIKEKIKMIERKKN